MHILLNIFLLLFDNTELNWAHMKTATQVSTYSNNSMYQASSANDGDLSTLSITGDQPDTKWWIVDIGQTIIFRSATVYVREGVCETTPGSYVECCK